MMVGGEIVRRVVATRSISELHVFAEWSAPDGLVHKRPYLWVWAEVDGHRVGRCAFAERFRSGTWEAFGDPGVLVDVSWRRLGVARAMYEVAASLLPGPIYRSRDLSADGHAFWGKLNPDGVLCSAISRRKEEK